MHKGVEVSMQRAVSYTSTPLHIHKTDLSDSCPLMGEAFAIVVQNSWRRMSRAQVSSSKAIVETVMSRPYTPQNMLNMISLHRQERAILSSAILSTRQSSLNSATRDHCNSDSTMEMYMKMREDILSIDVRLLGTLEMIEQLEVNGDKMDESDSMILNGLLELLFIDKVEMYSDMWEDIQRSITGRDMCLESLNVVDLCNSECDTASYLRKQIVERVVDINRLVKYYKLIHPRTCNEGRTNTQLQTMRLLHSQLTLQEDATLTEATRCFKGLLSFYLTKASERRRDIWILEVMLTCDVWNILLNNLNACTRAGLCISHEELGLKSDITELLKLINTANEV